MSKRQKPQKALSKPEPSKLAAGNPLANPVIQATSSLFLSAELSQTKTAQSPLPSPDILARYEQVMPGSVDRLITLAENEAAHRRDMEQQAMEIQSRDQKAYRKCEYSGQICALFIGVFALSVAGYAAVHGAQTAGAIVGTGGVGGIVAAFIAGRNQLLKQKQMEFEQQKEASNATRQRHQQAQSAGQPKLPDATPTKI